MNEFPYDNWNDSFESEEDSLEKWLKENSEFDRIADVSDLILRRIKNKKEMTTLLLRTLFLFFDADYKEIRKYIEALFKRSYIDEECDNIVDDIMAEVMRPFPNEDKINKLSNKMDQLPDEDSDNRGPLDDINTIEDFLDRLDENPNQNLDGKDQQ